MSIRQTPAFDRTAVAGLALLGASSVPGAVLRNAAYITNYAGARAHAVSHTYVTGLRTPTAYLSIPLGQIGSLVINSISFLVSVSLFILGGVFVRK
jgi:hypothetical protein